MHAQIIHLPKQKTWGILPHSEHADHFATGYIWGVRSKDMDLGRNAIITGDFQITTASRGRSAANFSGHFRGEPDVSYEFGMQGMLHLIGLVQSGKFPILSGYIVGRWTFAKQGESVFLKPHVDA